MIYTEKKKGGSLDTSKTTAKSVNVSKGLHGYSTTVSKIFQVFLGFFIAIILIVITIKAFSGVFSVPELEPTLHRVRYGETLWEIAKQYKPDSMTMDEYMGWVYEQNSYSGDIYPGDVVIMGVEK